jgi:adenosine deaminase
MEETAREAEAELGITLRGIITCIRHFGPEKAKPIAVCAAETKGSFITGFGIAGDELIGKPKDYLWAFGCAREAGLRLTAHAGEWGGADSVRDAIRDLNVERIGHGVQAITDLALVDEIAEAGITLECCPGSNVFLGVFPSWRDHPIETLRERGVKVTVSTDDPPFFHTTMTREYDHLADTFGWDEEIFEEITANALAAAFCDEDTKDRVAKKLKKGT